MAQALQLVLLRMRQAVPAVRDAVGLKPLDRAVAHGRFQEGRLRADPSRHWMLYEPTRRRARAAPLLVMLHGCQQGAEEFAAGTRMNEAAEEAGVLVLYPEQTSSANALRCWNWYAAHDPDNPKGDAALIVAMTREVMETHRIDPTRVYVAGMSAGGAMAALLARDYPTLYAALGVHSGVPAGLASDVFSALRLMSKGPGPNHVDAVRLRRDAHGPAVPTIVFHGDQDDTVHPANGEALHALGALGEPHPAWPMALGVEEVTTDADGGQRGYTRSVAFGQGGVSWRELWIVHGAGHAWAGGNGDEAYTDEHGPDASREMLRFMLQHRATEAAVA
jgi:poly(hydroxyalkanoate) depolymerase family esterase